MLKNTIKISAALALFLSSSSIMAAYPVGVQDSFIVPNLNNNNGAGQQTLDVLNNDTGDNLRIIEVNDWTVNGGRATIFQGPYYTAPFGRYIRYTPRAGFTGQDSFWYAFEDAQGRTNAARVIVNVLPNSDTPYPNPRNDEVTVQQGKTIRIQALENDVTSPEFTSGGTQSISAFTQSTSGGRVERAPGANSLSYTPRNGFTGKDQFTYTVSIQTDRFSFATKQATVNINVTSGYSAGPYPYTKPDTATSSSGSSSIAIYPLDNDIGRGLRIANSGQAYSSKGGRWFVSGGNDKAIIYSAPSSQFTGIDKIYYIIEDELGRKNWGVVSINIQ